MKIFAYDKIKGKAAGDKIQSLLKEEAQHAWDLHKKGIFREIYFRTDKPGVMVVLECKDVNEAQKYMKELPLVREGLIEFEFIPVGAFTPFETLFG